jgi:hypothetical protein
MNAESLAELQQEYEAWLVACRLVDEANYNLWEAYCERRSEAYLLYRDADLAQGYEEIAYPSQPVGTHRFNYPRVEANYMPPTAREDEIPF